MPSTPRLAGTIVLIGVATAIVWRLAIAPAVLGDFNPADMPHRDRALLSTGVVCVAVLFAVAQHLIARWLEPTAWRGLAKGGAWLGTGAAVTAATGSTILVWSGAGALAFSIYVVLMGAAWALVGFAMFRAVPGSPGKAALATAIVYALAAVAVFAGAFIIFVMTLAAMPLGFALVFRREAGRGSTLALRAADAQRL